MPPLVSFIVATYNRGDDLAESIESILDQDYENFEIIVLSNSDEPETHLFESGELAQDNVQFYHYDERMGVTKARNVAYERANGDIYVTIDDDAILKDESTTTEIVRLFEENTDVGILAFKIVNYFDESVEFPKQHSDLERKVGLPPQMKPTRSEDVDTETEVSTFMGAGNAFRASLLEEVGDLPPEFTYGSEELDFSLRTIDAGYKVLYVPSIQIEHKRAQSGRIEDREDVRRCFENRLRIAIRRLPMRFVLFSLVFWGGRALYRARFDPRPGLRALGNTAGQLAKLLGERDPIDETTVDYIDSVGGRCW